MKCAVSSFSIVLLKKNVSQLKKTMETNNFTIDANSFPVAPEKDFDENAIHQGKVELF